MILNTRNETAGNFDLACRLYQSGAYAEAYTMFSSLAKQKESVSLLVNLALCHIQAESWDGALLNLEKAQSMSAVSRPEDFSFGDPLYQKLFEKQALSDGYKEPLPEDAPQHAAQYTTHVVTRLLIDVYAAKKMWAKVKALAQPLISGGYLNVINAVKQAEKY